MLFIPSNVIQVNVHRSYTYINGYHSSVSWSTYLYTHCLSMFHDPLPIYSSSNKALLKVAHMCATLQKFDKSADLFEEVKVIVVNNILLAAANQLKWWWSENRNISNLYTVYFISLSENKLPSRYEIIYELICCSNWVIRKPGCDF